ncbi:centromere protein F isoform X2 [Hydra vulgaris]|uniref:Centromere protein F isoform X2 n=1 Tax=Hydra vulgaris TaxID=6087 RepID=A0ABM4C448_HYDVU
MSWAQDEWKNNLPHVAIQKIDAIERQNDQLKREVQQKKFLLENAEVALEQQKNKTAQEKSQNTVLRKDLQALEERCRESEITKEKVLHDMQTKDTRINCLDGQLVKFKAALEEESLKLTKLQTEHEQEILVRNKAQDLLKQKENDIEKLKQRLSSSSEDVFKQTNVLQTTAVDSLISFDEPAVQTTYCEKISEPSLSESQKKVGMQSSVYNIFGDIDINQTNNELSSNESLKKQLADLDTKLKLKQAEMIKLQQQYTDTCFSLDKLKMEFNSNLSEMTKVNDEVVKLRANCEEKQLQNADLQRNIKMLQQQYECERHNSKAALKAQEARMKEQEKETREEMSRDQQHIKNQFNELQMQISEIQKKWNDSRHENQIFERNLFQVNQDKETLKLSIEEQKQELLLIKSNHINSLNDLKAELEKTHLKEVTTFKNKIDEKARELAAMIEDNKMQKVELLNVSKSLLEANNSKKELEEIKTAMEKRVLQLSQIIEENKQNARSQLSELEKEMAKKLADKNDHNISLSKAVEEHLIKIKELSKDLEQKKSFAEDLKCKWESSEFKFSKLYKEKCDVDKEFSVFKSCAEKKENEMAVMLERFVVSEKLMKEQECKLKDITEKLNVDLFNSKKHYQELTMSVSKKDQELLNATEKLEAHEKIVFELENKLMEQSCTLQLLLTEKDSFKSDFEKKQLELVHERDLLKDDFEKKQSEFFIMLKQKDIDLIHLTEEHEAQKKKLDNVVKSLEQLADEKIHLKSQLDEVLVVLSEKKAEVEEMKLKTLEMQNEEQIRNEHLAKVLEEKSFKIISLESYEQECRCAWEKELKAKSDLLSENQITISDLNQKSNKLMADLDVANQKFITEHELYKETEMQQLILKDKYEQSQQALQNKCAEISSIEQIFQDQYVILKESLQHKTESCNDLVEQIQAMLETLKVLESTKMRLENNISSLEEDNEQLISEKSELSCRLEEKDSQLKETNHKYDAIFNQLNDVSFLLSSKEQELALLQQDFKRLEQNSISKENDFKVCIDELKAKNAEIDYELSSISKQAGMLKEENEVLNKNNSMILKDLTEISVLHTYVCNERNQLVADVKLLKEEITESIGLMQSKESSLQQLNSDQERLREDFQMKTKLYEDLLSERNQTKKNLKNAQDQLQQVTLLFDEKVENLKSLTLELEVKEKSMQELQNNKEKIILELQSVINTLQKQLSALEEEVMLRREELRYSVLTTVKLQANLKEIQEELSLLKESKKNADEQAEELVSKINYLESDIVRKDLLLTEVESQMKKNLNSYEGKILEKQDELFLAEGKTKEYLDVLEKMKANFLQLSEDFNVCMSEKTDVEKRLTMLMNKVELQESSISEKNEFIKLSEQQIDELSSQLKNVLISKQEQADEFSLKFNEIREKTANYLEEIDLIQKIKLDLEKNLKDSEKLLDLKEIENKNIKVSVNCLTDKIKEKDSEFTILLEQHNQTKVLLDQSNSLIESLKITLCETEQNNQDLELSLKTLKVDKNNLIDRMNQEINAKVESNILIQNALDSMNTRFEELQKNFSKQANAFESLSKQYDAILSEKVLIEQLLFTSTEQKTFAEGMVLTLETKCASIEREKLTVIKMNVDLKEEIDVCKSELEVYKMQKADSVSLLSKRDELVKSLYEDIKNLQNDLESKIEEMIEMEQSFAKEKSEYQDTLLQLENNVFAKEFEIKTLLSEKELMKNKHKKNAELVICLTEEIKKKDDVLVNNKLKSEKEMQNYVYQIEKLNEEIKLLELKLHEHSADLKVKSDTIQDLRISLLASQEKNDVLKQEKETEIKDKIAIIDSKDTEIVEMQMTMNIVKNQLEHATLQFNESCLQFDLLNKQKVELQSQHGILTNDFALKEKLYAELKKIADEEKTSFETKMQQTIEAFQLEKKLLIEEQFVMSKTLETNKEKINCLENEILILKESFFLTNQELFEKNEECKILNLKFEENLKTEKMHKDSINELTYNNCTLQNEKQNLIAEIGKLQNFCNENKKFIETLFNEKEDLTSQLNTVTCDRDRFFTENNDKSEEVSKLHCQLNDVTNQHSVYTESLNQSLEKYKVKEVEFLEVISALEVKNSILDAANTRLKQTCEDLRSCLQKTFISFTDLNNLLDEKENDKEAIENNFFDVEEFMKTLSGIHNQLSHNFKKMQKKEKNAFLEKEKAQKLFDELNFEYKKQFEHSVLLQQELQNVQKDLEVATIEKDQLFVKSKELELSKSQIENELKLSTASCQQLSKIEEMLESKTNELEDTKDKLNKQKIAHTEKEAGFDIEKQSLINALNTIEKEKVCLEENLNKKDQILNEIQLKLNCAEKNLVFSEEKLQEQKKSCDNFISEHRFLQESIKNLQLVLDEKILSISALDNKLKDVVEDRSLVNTRLEELRDSYENVMSSMLNLQNESSSLKKEKEQLYEKNNIYMNDLSSAEALTKQLNEKIENIQKNLEVTTIEKDQLFIKSKELELSKSQIENELKLSTASCQHLSKIEEMLESKTNELEDTKDKLNKQKIAHTEKEAGFDIEKQSLINALNTIEKEKVCLEENLNKKDQMLNEILLKLNCAEKNLVFSEEKLQEQKKSCDNFISEHRFLQESIKNLQLVLDEKILSISALDNKLKDVVEDRSLVNTRLEELRDSYENVMSSMLNLQNESSSLKKEKEQLYEKNNTYMNDLLSAEVLIKQLNEKVENLANDYISCEKEKANMQEMNSQKEFQVLHLKEELSLKEKNLEIVYQCQNELKGELAEWKHNAQEMMDQKEFQILHLKEELSLKEKNLEIVNRSQNELKGELEEWKHKAAKAQNIIECLNTDLLKYEKSIALKELDILEKVEFISSEKKKKEDLQLQQQKMIEKLNSAMNENSEKTITLEQLKKSLLEIECSNRKLLEQTEILSSKNDIVEKELSENKQLYDKLYDDFNKKEKRLNDYQHENTELNAQLAVSADYISELSLSIKINEEKIDVLTKEKDKLVISETNLREQLDNIFSEIQKKDSLYVDIKNEREVLQGLIEELSSSKEEKILSLTNHYEAKNMKYKSQLKEINIQKENLLNIKAKLETELNSLTQSFQYLQTEKDELTEQLSITLKNLSEYKETHLSTLKEKDDLNAEFKKLQEEFRDAKESLEYISTVKDEYKSQFQLKSEEFNRLKEKHLEEIKILNATIIAMNVKKEQIKVHLDALIEEKIVLDEELRAKINEVLLLKESVEKYTLEIARLENVYSHELDKNDLLNADISHLKISVDEIKGVLDNERNIAMNIQIKFDKASQTVQNLEKDLATISNNLLLKTKECNGISEKLASVFLELNYEKEKNISKQSKLDQIKNTLLQNRVNHSDVDPDESIDFSSLILQLQEKVAILERDQNRAIEKAVDEERMRIVEASKKFVLERENENERRNQDLFDEIETKNKKIENLLKKVNHLEELCKEYKFTIEKEKQAYMEVVRQCEDHLKTNSTETKAINSNVDELHELQERLNLIKEQNENLKSDLIKTVSNYEKEQSKETRRYEILKEEFNTLKALYNVQDADLKKLHLLAKEPISNLKQIDSLRESLSKCKEESTEFMLKNDELEKKYKILTKEKDKEISSLNKQISLSMENNECLQKQIKELLLKIAEFEKLFKASNSLMKVSLVSPITKSLSGLKVLSSEEEECLTTKSIHTPKRTTQDPSTDTSAKKSRLTSVKEEVREPKQKESSTAHTHSRRRKSLRLAAKPYSKDLSSSDEDLLNKPASLCDKENIAATSTVSYLQSDSAFGLVSAPLSPVRNKNQNPSIVRSKKIPQEVKVLHSPVTTRVTRSKSGSSLKVEPTIVNNRSASVANSSDAVNKIDARKILKTDLGSDDEKCNMQ